MGVSTAATLIRAALLIGFLTVNLSAQKKQKPPANPFSNDPGPGWFSEQVDSSGKLPGMVFGVGDNAKLRAARDPLRVDPAHYHLELEKEGMRVLRFTLEADETSLMHY